MTLTHPDLQVLRPEHVVSITADVWRAYLSQELVEHSLGVDAPAISGRSVTGCVNVSGAWQGSVFVQCSADLACGLAETMFMADPGSLTADEVGDGLGELTNMVGGNIKSRLPGPSRLSLPSVAQGASCTVGVPGADLLHRVALMSPGGPVMISVWKASST